MRRLPRRTCCAQRLASVCTDFHSDVFGADDAFWAQRAAQHFPGFPVAPATAQRAAYVLTMQARHAAASPAACCALALTRSTAALCACRGQAA
jgi:hypothetical protein